MKSGDTDVLRGMSSQMEMNKSSVLKCYLVWFEFELEIWVSGYEDSLNEVLYKKHDKLKSYVWCGSPTAGWLNSHVFLQTLYKFTATITNLDFPQISEVHKR